MSSPSKVGAPPPTVYLQQYPDAAKRVETAKKQGVKIHDNSRVVKASEKTVGSRVGNFFSGMFSPSKLAKELLIIDEKQIEADKKSVEDLQSGAFFISLMPVLKPLMNSFLLKQEFLGKDKVEELLNRPEGELLKVIEACIYKAISNLKNKSPKVDKVKMSFANILAYMEEGVVKIKDPSLAKRRKDAENCGDVEKMQQVIKEINNELMLVMFPNGKKDLGINLSYPILGKQVADTIWDIISNNLPGALAPIFNFVMEMEDQCAKQRESLLKLEGGHAVDGLAKIGASNIQQSLYASCQASAKNEPESLYNTIKKIANKLFKNLYKNDKLEAAELDAKCAEGAEELTRLVTVITRTKNPHPSHHLTKNFIVDRIYAVITQALAHIVSASTAKSNNLLTKLYEAIKPIALDIYFKEGESLKKEFMQIAKLSSSDPKRIAWTKTHLTSYSERVLKLINLDEELKRRDPITLQQQAKYQTEKEKYIPSREFDIEKILAEETPGVIFSVLKVIFDNEPGLLALINPDFHSIEKFPYQPLYNVFINYAVNQLMTSLPQKLSGENAETLTDKILGILYEQTPHISVEFVQKQIDAENAQQTPNQEQLLALNKEKREIEKSKTEQRDWLIAEIIKVGADQSYKALRTFIETNALQILTNRFFSIGSNKSPLTFLAECIETVNAEFNKQFQGKALKELNEQLAKLSRLDAYTKISGEKDNNGTKASPSRRDNAARSELDHKHLAAQPDVKAVNEKKSAREKLVEEIAVTFRPLARTLMDKLGLQFENRLMLGKANELGKTIDDAFLTQLNLGPQVETDLADLKAKEKDEEMDLKQLHASEKQLKNLEHKCKQRKAILDAYHSGSFLEPKEMVQLGLNPEQCKALSETNCGLIVQGLAIQMVEFYRELLGPKLSEKQVNDRLIDIFYQSSASEPDPRHSLLPKALKKHLKASGVTKKIDIFNQTFLAGSNAVVQVAQKAIGDVGTSFEIVSELDASLKMGLEKDQKAKELLAAEIRHAAQNKEKGLQILWQHAAQTVAPNVLTRAVLNLVDNISEPKAAAAQADQKEAPKHPHDADLEKILIRVLGILTPLLNSFSTSEVANSPKSPIKSAGSAAAKSADDKEMALEVDEKASNADLNTLAKTATKQIIELFQGQPQNDPLELLPGFTLDDRNNIWKKAHTVLQQTLSSSLTQMDQRAAAKQALLSLEKYFSQSPDEDTQAKRANPCSDLALVLKALTRDKIVPELLKDTAQMKEVIKDFLVPFLSSVMLPELKPEGEVKNEADLKANAVMIENGDAKVKKEQEAVQSKKELDAKQTLVEDYASTLADWIAPNLKNLAESNHPAVQALMSFLGNLVEQFSLIAMQGFISTFGLIDATPHFMVTLVSEILTDLATHIDIIDKITKEQGEKEPSKVDPEIMLEKYASYAPLVIHPSLRPIVLSEAEQATIKDQVESMLKANASHQGLSERAKTKAQDKLIKSEISKLKNSKADAQEIKEFFNPLFDNCLVIFDITEDRLPCPEAMQKDLFKMITDRGPKLLQKLYNEGTGSSSQDSIKLSIIELIQESIDELNKEVTVKEKGRKALNQFKELSSYGVDGAAKSDQEDKIKNEQRVLLTQRCGELFDRGLKWTLKDPLAKALIKNLKFFKNLSKEKMVTVILTALEENPPSKIAQKQFMAATTAIHPGLHNLAGAFFAKMLKRDQYDKHPLGIDVEYAKQVAAKDLTFVQGTPEVEKQKEKWNIDRKIDNATKVIENGAQMMTTGINNGLSEAFYDGCKSIANFFYNIVKFISRSEEIANKIGAFFNYVFTAIHKGLQLAIHASNISNFIVYIQNKVNTSNISLSDRNVKMSINETFCRTAILKATTKLADLKRPERAAREKVRLEGLQAKKEEAIAKASGVAAVKVAPRTPVAAPHLAVRGRELGMAIVANPA